MSQKGGWIKGSKMLLSGPKSETLISGSVLPPEIMGELGMRPEKLPDFPDTWVMAGSKEATGLVVWLNGNNVSHRYLAFEKLYTARTAYWGGVCLFIQIGPTGGYNPLTPPAPAPLIYAFRRGIIVWDTATEIHNEN